ncbi:MAG: hypothetical protein KF859_07115 [Phycisphaeraceae bacterium]|nr:hypothetical protein [Phycisphaeraceae bacterium]
MGPPSLAISRASALQLAAVATLGLGAVVAGGALSPLLLPILGVGGIAMAGEAVASFAINVIAGVFGDEAKRWQSESERAHRSKQNHGVQRAINLAIAGCLRKAAASYPKGVKPPEYLTGIAKSIEENPLSLCIEALPGAQGSATPGIDEAAATSILSGDINTIRGRDVLTTAQWTELLRRAGAATCGLHPRDSVEKGVEFCEEHFTTELVRVLKELGAESDPAWFAIVLRFLGEIYADVKEIKGAVKDIKEGAKAQADALDSLKRAFEDHAAAITKAFEALRLACERRAKDPGLNCAARDAEEVAAIKAIAERLGNDLPQLSAALERIEETFRLLHEKIDAMAADAKRGADGVAYLVDESKKGRLKFAADFSDNLHTVWNNEAAFKGRVDDLAELHRRVINDPPGVPIPVIAAPGMGKSALVTRYVFMHRADFDHVWWVRASTRATPGGTTPEERSLASLLDLWGIDSKAIQGDEHTPRVDALAAEVRAWLARPKEDGTPTRHLVVLDNADDYATVKRFRLNAPSRVIFTSRARSMVRDGARAMELKALSPDDGLLVLRAKTDRWNADDFATPLTDLGGLVDWNALALVYLGAVLARPSTTGPAAVRDELARALARGGTWSLSTPRPEEQPDDYDSKVEEAFALFIAPYAQKPEMALLDAAAWCAPDNIAVDLLRGAAGLGGTEFNEALDKLVAAGVLDFEGNSVNIHRLTQVCVRGDQASRGGDASAAVLQRLLAALIDLFADDALYNKDLKRTAALPHAQAVLARVLPLARSDGEGAAAPLPHAPEEEAAAARLHAEVTIHLALSGQLAEAARHIDTAIGWVENQPIRPDGVLAILYAKRASVQQHRGNLAGAEEDIDRAIEWGKGQSPQFEHLLATWYASRANTRYLHGDLAGAEKDIALSIQFGESRSPRNEHSLADFYATRAKIRHSLGDLAQAEEDIDLSIDWMKCQTPRDERSLAVLTATRAGIRRELGNLPGAIADIQQAIDWEEAQPHPNQRELAIRYGSRARTRILCGDLEGAQRDIQHAIAWEEAQTLPNPRELAVHYDTKAKICEAACDLHGAEKYISQSINWGEIVCPRNERSLAISYATRARIRRDLGNLAGAEQDFEHAIRWGECQTPPDDRRLSCWYSERAMLHLARGNLAGAKRDIVWSICWGENQTPRDERSLAIWYTIRAQILLASGDISTAEEDIQRAIDWEEAQAKPNQRELAIRYVWRANNRQDRGDLAGAEQDIARSIDWGEKQSPRDERSLAICYALRASIRQDRCDLAGAEQDIARSIDWGEKQCPRDERSLALGYSSRARIRTMQATAARWAGDAAGAAALFAQAKADIDRSLAWWEANLPGDERTLAIFRTDKALIEKVAEGGELEGMERT